MSFVIRVSSILEAAPRVSTTPTSPDKDQQRSKVDGPGSVGACGCVPRSWQRRCLSAPRHPTARSHSSCLVAKSQQKQRSNPSPHSARSGDIRRCLTACCAQGSVGLTGNHRDRGGRQDPWGCSSDRARPSPWCLRSKSSARPDRAASRVDERTFGGKYLSRCGSSCSTQVVTVCILGA